MRQFLKTILSFTFIFIFAFIIVLEITETVIRKKANFKIIKNSKYLLLGHSHPECAFNDSLIDNFINLSKFGDSYYYTYFKAKKVLEQNPNIEIVFIEYTNNQINETMNDLIWGNNYLRYRYPVYSPFIGKSDKKVLAQNNIKGFINSNSLSLKYNLSQISKKNFNYTSNIGGYVYLVRDKTDSLLKVKSITNNQLDNENISEYNILYLSKIIDLCNKLNKTVFFIRSPLHKKYEGYSNEIKYQEIRQNSFSSIQYLDFSKFPLKNSEFGDFSHLNYKGAKVFSIWFNQLLDKGLTEKINKQIFIDEEIKKHFD